MSFETGTNMFFDDIGLAVEYAVLPPDHLELWSTSETIYYGDTVDVDVVPVGIDSLFSPLGRDEDIEFSIQLIGETSKYGQLIFDGDTGSYFEHIPSIDRIGTGVQFAANGIEPDSSVDLTFHLVATFIGEVIASKVGAGPDTNQLQAVPTKLTAKMSLNPKTNLQQTTLPFNRQLRKTSKISTTESGDRISSKISTESNVERAQNLKQSEISLLRQKIRKNKIGRLATSGTGRKATTRSASRISLSVSTTAKTADGYVVMENDCGTKEEIAEILLGETQYFGAKITRVKERPILEIEQATLGDDGVPQLDGAEQNIKWIVANDPENKPEKGLSVYYEYKYPKWVDNGKGGKIFSGMGELPKGLIRLLGRRWIAGKTFNIVLTAIAGTEQIQISDKRIIQVEKPTQLGGDKGNARARRYYRDIDGTSVNIDELCIKYGGSIGIPPQFIKGQIHNECSYNGDLNLLVPSFRYEPYEQPKRDLKKYRSNPYYIRSLTDNSMGFGQCVPSASCTPEHQYVGDIPYVLYPKSLWDFIWDYSEIGTLEPPPERIPPITSSQHKIYGEWTSEGMNFHGLYTDMQNWHDELYDYCYKTDPMNAEKNARELMAQQISANKSTVIAQTRILASYGFLQTMYTTAIEEIGYPKSKRPEEINIAATCELYQFRHLENVVYDQLHLFLGDYENEWDEGFEQFFIDHIYPEWNGRLKYPTEVISNSSFYLPQ
jgi:hypothetical protein